MAVLSPLPQSQIMWPWRPESVFLGVVMALPAVWFVTEHLDMAPVVLDLAEVFGSLPLAFVTLASSMIALFSMVASVILVSIQIALVCTRGRMPLVDGTSPLPMWDEAERGPRPRTIPALLPMLEWPFSHFLNRPAIVGPVVFKEHGPMVLLWHRMRPVLFIGDPEVARELYEDHYDHPRDSTFQLGDFFVRTLSHCTATAHGRDAIRHARWPYDRYLSHAFFTSPRVWGQLRESVHVWMDHVLNPTLRAARRMEAEDAIPELDAQDVRDAVARGAWTGRRTHEAALSAAAGHAEHGFPMGDMDVGLPRLTIEVIGSMLFGPERAVGAPVRGMEDGARDRSGAAWFAARAHDMRQIFGAMGTGVGGLARPLVKLLSPRLDQLTDSFTAIWHKMHEGLMGVLMEEDARADREAGGDRARVTATDTTRYASAIAFLAHGQRIGASWALPLVEVEHTMNEMLLANADVTSTAIAFILADLARHPTWQDRVRDEIRSVYGATSVLDAPADRLKELTALQLCVMESARMNPVIGLTFLEATAKERVLGGYRIPANTLVCVDAYSLSYMEDVWENRETFDPSRFDESTPLGARTAKHPLRKYALLRFGLGPRKCQGQHVARVITVAIAASLIQRYRLTPAPDAPEGLPPPFNNPLRTEGVPFFTPFVPIGVCIEPLGEAE